MDDTGVPDNRDKLDEILARYGEPQGNLIMILHEVQGIYNYLPKEALVYISEKTGFSLQRIYSIATFYNHFSLKARGKHLLHVCMGTACHVQGASRVIEEFEKQLDVKEGDTSKDGLFTLEAVRCVGACSLAPVVLVDGDTHAGVLPRKAKFLLKKYKPKGKP